MLRQPLDNAAVMAFAEIGLYRRDHRLADLVQRIHLRDGFGIVVGHLERGLVKGLPGAVAARQRQRGGLADMADAERIDETIQRYVAAAANRGEQVADRG